MKLFKFIPFVAMAILAGGVVAAKNAPIAARAEEGTMTVADYNLFVPANITLSSKDKTIVPTAIAQTDPITQTLGKEGETTWYVAAGEVQAYMNLLGNVNIILTDGCDLNCRAIRGGNLTIWGQEAGTGYLHGYDSSEIYSTDGVFTINGGSVSFGGGMGSGLVAGTFTMNAGSFTTYADYNGKYGIKADTLNFAGGSLKAYTNKSNSSKQAFDVQHFNISEKATVAAGDDAESLQPAVFDTDWNTTFSGKKYVTLDGVAEGPETPASTDSKPANVGLVIGIVTGVIAVVVGAYFGIGYLVFAKGKLKGKFFEIIYGWMKKSK